MSTPINRHLVGLEAYVPGEQPAEPGWVKLNTNENPYPPAPDVIEVLRSFAPEGIRMYPPPDCARLRRAIGERLDWPVDGVLVTNGSDEALRLLCHAFLNSGDRIGMLWPTYSLYPILGQMFGAASAMSDVGRRGEWPDRLELDGVRLFFLSNPNPPYGTFYQPDQVAKLVGSCSGILFVIDEAYVEFAGCDCQALLGQFDNVFVVRTFSKSHSLAGLRVGFVLGQPERVRPLQVVRDSYNVNALSQSAALAAWQADDYYRAQIAEIVALRGETARRLVELGFDVLPSGANFIFARHSEAQRLFSQLKARKILVRYFDSPPTRDGLRITIGMRTEMDTLMRALEDLLAAGDP